MWLSFTVLAVCERMCGRKKCVSFSQAMGREIFINVFGENGKSEGAAGGGEGCGCKYYSFDFLSTVICSKRF